MCAARSTGLLAMSPAPAYSFLTQLAASRCCPCAAKVMFTALPTQGDAQVPGAYSPAASPLRGSAQADAAAAPPGAVSPAFGSDAVWAGIGRDGGAGRDMSGPVSHGGSEAGGDAISARDRENMYRMYSQHVEVRRTLCVLLPAL